MYVTRAVHILKASGYRITSSRKSVLGALERAERPMSPYELQKMLEQSGQHLDHVTIYRTLEILGNLNLAHRVTSLGGFVRCSLDYDEACHRYVVCRRCGAFFEFADETLCKKEQEVVRGFGFLTEQHVAESLGLCAACND